MPNKSDYLGLPIDLVRACDSSCVSVLCPQALWCSSDADHCAIADNVQIDPLFHLSIATSQTRQTECGFKGNPRGAPGERDVEQALYSHSLCLIKQEPACVAL